jgi:hypothetical protein
MSEDGCALAQWTDLDEDRGVRRTSLGRAQRAPSPGTGDAWRVQLWPTTDEIVGRRVKTSRLRISPATMTPGRRQVRMPVGAADWVEGCAMGNPRS